MFLLMSNAETKNLSFFNTFQEKLNDVQFIYKKGTDPMDVKARLLKQLFYRMRLKQFNSI